MWNTSAAPALVEPHHSSLAQMLLALAETPPQTLEQMATSCLEGRDGAAGMEL